MPSHLHEALVEMFRGRPVLAAELLGGPLAVAVPAFEQARLSSGELTEVAPTEFRADVVVSLTAGQAPVLAVVVEVQLRADARNRRSWPAYVAALHARLGCPVLLLVVCPDPAVAAWCAAPVVVGEPGLVLTPLVLGPGQVPVVTDVGLARRSPELAVLSAMAHGGRPGQERVLEALLAGLHVVGHDRAGRFADVVLAVLPAAARACLEALMTTTTHEYQSDFARRYFNQGRTNGRVEGEASAVLAILDARGVDVPDEVRKDIASCTDLDQLDTWIRRAATANKINELFAPMTTTYEYQSDFARRYFNQGRTEGRVEGEASAVLAILDARGVDVPDEVRKDIASCTDLDQLDTWVRCAATARKVHELFD